jgi:hypothetical protein
MGKRRLRHLGRLVNHPVSHHEAVNAILLTTVGTLLVEKSRIRVAIPKIGDPSPLPCDRALEGCIPKVGELQRLVKPYLMRRKCPVLAGFVESQYKLPTDGQLVAHVPHQLGGPACELAGRRLEA